VATLQSITPIVKNGLPFTGAIVATLTNFLNDGIDPSLIGSTYLYVLDGVFVDNPISQTPTNYILPDANYYVKYICDSLSNISCYGVCHNTHQWDLTTGGTYDFYPDIFLGAPQTFILETASSYKATIDQLQTEYDTCTSELSTLQQQIADSTTEDELAQCLLDLVAAQDQITELNEDNTALLADLETCTTMLEDKMTEEEIQAIIDGVLDKCPADGQLPVGNMALVELESATDVAQQQQAKSNITSEIATMSSNLCQNASTLYGDEQVSTSKTISNPGSCNSGCSSTVGTTSDTVTPTVDPETNVRNTVRGILATKLKSKKSQLGLKLTPTERPDTPDVDSVLSGIKKNCRNATFPKKLVLDPVGEAQVCDPETIVDPPTEVVPAPCPCDPSDAHFFVNPN
jgi:hypothetical protein